MRLFFSITGLLLLSLVPLTGCRKSEKQKAEVRLHFQTRFSSSDYYFMNSFTNGDGMHLRLELLQFYLSDIRFISEKKEKEIVVEDIALVRCENGSGQVTIKIPAGDYSALRFGVGVSKELNESDPSEFNEADHPLNTTQGTYWGMNSMYRFVMIDGRYDIGGDGVSDGTFSYHTGYNESYREVELVKDFSFNRKGSYDVYIGIDVGALFYVSGSMIDIVNEPNYHGSLSAVDLSYRLSDNFASSLGIYQ